MTQIIKKSIKDFLKRKKNNVILISSTFLKKNSKVLPIIRSNSKKFYKIKIKIPEYEFIKKIDKEISTINFDNLIGIGGGKVLDIAKNINFNLKKKGLKRKLIVIPTLFGSGSEITSSAVYFKKKKKYTIQDKSIQPDIICINKNLLNYADKKNVIISALDCMCQSMESVWSKKSNSKSIKLATKSFRLSYNFLNLKKKVISRENYKLSQASLLIGKAMNITRTTAPHALSYSLTSNLGIPHGVAVGLLMKPILEINLNKMKNKKIKKIIFKFFLTKDTKKIISNYTEILEKNGFKKKLFLSEKLLQKFTKDINLERLKNNPVKLSNKEIFEIYKTL